MDKEVFILERETPPGNAWCVGGQRVSQLSRHGTQCGGSHAVTAPLRLTFASRKFAACTATSFACCQALAALLFLYRQVLGLELGWFDDLVRAKRPVRLPVVLSTQATTSLLEQLQGQHWLMASLLYGAGLRLMECLRLRVKDVDFAYRQILVRDGKGRKDRVTMFPREYGTADAATTRSREETARFRSRRDMARRTCLTLWRAVFAGRIRVGLAVCVPVHEALGQPG